MICFDSYELDTHARELRRGAERVRLQVQPFELLAMMLEHPGDVVTRAAVKRLRAVLGDDARHPRFVETLPRRGYRFIAPCTWSEPGRGAGGPARVAVLPFTDGVRETRARALGDGLTDETIVHLGQYTHVELVARMSSATFKSGTCFAREVGTALDADYLIEGSVRYAGDRARIAAWLVDTASETSVWTGLYDRCLGDDLAVQTDVARRIAHSLASAISTRPRRATAFIPRARALSDRARGLLVGVRRLNGV